jgi:DNA-binding transcriptional LysR family regulator
MSALHSRLKLRHLELFRNVCDLQTLRKAADASSMTQPAATKLVQEMEEMFGAPLFERDRRGMKLTQQGAVVRRHIDILLADVGNMRAEVDLFSQGATGRIRLGIIPSLASALLAESIARTLAANPGVRFNMQEGATTELLASLARNDLDLCFGRVLDEGTAARLRVINVYTESFAIVCGTGHPLARNKRLPWSRLAQEQWALPVAGTPLRELADSLFTRNKVLRPAVSVESSSFHQMRHLIARSRLIGVVPRSIALQGQAAKDLVLLKPDVGADFAPISLILRKEFDQPPLIEEFARRVCATARSLKLR